MNSIEDIHVSTHPGKTPELARAPQIVELPELKAHASPGAPMLAGNASVIQGVKVRLRVLAGEATMTVAELVGLREDAILKLDRPIDEPVDILLDGQVVARGHLVAVDDEFGVLVTELPRPAKP
jgi:flagellar motor switch protein FliN